MKKRIRLYGFDGYWSKDTWIENKEMVRATQGVQKRLVPTRFLSDRSVKEMVEFGYSYANVEHSFLQ